MELHNQPVERVENKFVITEDRVCFLPSQDRIGAPRFVEILGEIFDLEDMKTFEVVNGQISGGKIILGYYDPSTKPKFPGLGMADSARLWGLGETRAVAVVATGW